jgi:hypothetical protein
MLLLLSRPQWRVWELCTATIWRAVSRSLMRCPKSSPFDVSSVVCLRLSAGQGFAFVQISITGQQCAAQAPQNGHCEQPKGYASIQFGRTAGCTQALRTMGMLDSAYWASWGLWEVTMAFFSAHLICIFGASLRSCEGLRCGVHGRHSRLCLTGF